MPQDQQGNLNAPAIELYDTATSTLTDISALIPVADQHSGETFGNLPSVSADGQYVLFQGQYSDISNPYGNDVFL